MSKFNANMKELQSRPQYTKKGLGPTSEDERANVFLTQIVKRKKRRGNLWSKTNKLKKKNT